MAAPGSGLTTAQLNPPEQNAYLTSQGFNINTTSTAEILAQTAEMREMERRIRETQAEIERLNPEAGAETAAMVDRRLSGRDRQEEQEEEEERAHERRLEILRVAGAVSPAGSYTTTQAERAQQAQTIAEEAVITMASSAGASSALESLGRFAARQQAQRQRDRQSAMERGRRAYRESVGIENPLPSVLPEPQQDEAADPFTWPRREDGSVIPPSMNISQRGARARENIEMVNRDREMRDREGLIRAYRRPHTERDQDAQQAGSGGVQARIERMEQRRMELIVQDEETFEEFLNNTHDMGQLEAALEARQRFLSARHEEARGGEARDFPQDHGAGTGAGTAMARLMRQRAELSGPSARRPVRQSVSVNSSSSPNPWETADAALTRRRAEREALNNSEPQNEAERDMTPGDRIIERIRTQGRARVADMQHRGDTQHRGMLPPRLEHLRRHYRRQVDDAQAAARETAGVSAPPPVDGLGDRARSISPSNDTAWDTLLTSITPDPQAPSAESSFTSAAASAGNSFAPSNTSSSATSVSDDSGGPSQFFENICETFESRPDSGEEGEGDSEDIAVLRRAAQGEPRTVDEPTLDIFWRGYTEVVTRRADRVARHSGVGRGVGGGENTGLGGMQRIVQRLAGREDIPDEWWASAGLARIVPAEEPVEEQ